MGTPEHQRNTNLEKPPFILGIIEDELSFGDKPPFYWVDGKNGKSKKIPNFTKLTRGWEEDVPPPLVLLIDSIGGITWASDEIVSIIQTFRRKGGRTITYGTRWVMSAAAEIWAAAEERYVLQDTLAMWHTSWNLHGGAAVRDEEKAEAEKKALATFFEENATGEVREIALMILEDGEDPEARIDLGGKELKEGGLAKRAFRKTSDMERHFFDQAGWPAQEDKPDFVMNFFRNPIVEALTQSDGSRLRRRAWARKRKSGIGP